MIALHTKIACCGCGTCAQACPRNCIKLETDREGFWYPVVDRERCVECGACERVCPMLHPGEKPEEISVFAACCLEENVRETSSSGGVFQLLAEAVLSEGGAVFGAAFGMDHSVQHVMVTSHEQLPRLKGSKYVQSAMGDCYCQAAEKLRSGELVLFTGTPCQVAGLKRYIKKDYENLFAVDILCHGVPSPTVWKTYKKEQQRKYDCEIKTVSFRHKSFGWHQFSMMLEFENGEGYDIVHREDPFMRVFLDNLCLRPSCHDCKFRESRSGADLTIGDAWGIEKWMPEMDDDKGTSVVIVNTTKGQALLEQVREGMELRQVDAETVLANNMVYHKSVRPHPNRKKFFAALQRGASMEELLQICRKPLWYRVLHLGYRILRKMKKLLLGIKP